MRIRPAVAALIAVLLGCAVLGVVGISVAGRTRPALAADLRHRLGRGRRSAEAHFGDSSPFAVLLRGPRGAIERQGPAAGPGAAPQTRGDR